MPFVKVSTNVARASVNADSTLKALSKSLSEALDRPEPYVMVQLELGQDMLMAGSTEPCAFIHIRSIGKIDTERNPKTVAALTATVATALHVPADRIFVNLDDIAPNNWGHNGNTIA
ncbi:hypothetical protein ATCC90586_007027 [Pythium insidiosum]|nr:hypothetical protein ATCC90586_007027 [Pythium insidiosum]